MLREAGCAIPIHMCLTSFQVSMEAFHQGMDDLAGITTADPDKGSEAACPEGECPGTPSTTSVAIVLNIWLEGPATTRAICMLN